MRICIACLEEKPLFEFGVNRAMEGGISRKCRACLSAYAKARREARAPVRPPNWKKKTVDMAEYGRRWREAHPGYMTAKKRKWEKKHADRVRIREAVKYAVRTGELERLPCFCCGAEKTEGHHPDYSQPLSVVWLCRRHHREVHVMARALMRVESGGPQK